MPMHLLEFRFAALRAHRSSMKFPPPCSQPQPLKLTIKSLKPSPDRSLRNFPSAVHNLCSAHEELDLKIHQRCSFVQLVAHQTCDFRCFFRSSQSIPSHESPWPSSSEFSVWGFKGFRSFIGAKIRAVQREFEASCGFCGAYLGFGDGAAG